MGKELLRETQYGFNGAVPTKRRKYDCVELVIKDGVVLQWGRPYEETEVWDIITIKVINIGLLQWGRPYEETEVLRSTQA